MSSTQSSSAALRTPVSILESSSLKFDELDAITFTPKSVQGNSDTTTSIRLNITKAEGELTNELRTYASASHHIAVLQANVEQDTVPKGLTPSIKLTAFKQNAVLEVAVNTCLAEASSKILNCLLHHYQNVKAQAKNNAIRIEKDIKHQIEDSNDPNTWSTIWKQSKELAETTSQEHAKTLANKRTGKRANNPTDTEVHNYTNTVTKVTCITSNVSTESTTQHLPQNKQPREEMEKPPKQRGPLPKRPRQKCQRPRTKRERPTKLLREIKRHNKKQLTKYQKKYSQTNTIINTHADNILNLSTYNLSNDELLILSKGLSFIPKIKSLDIDEITDDVNTFENRMAITLKRHLEKDDSTKRVTRSTNTEIPVIPQEWRDHRGSLYKFRVPKPTIPTKPTVGSTLHKYLSNVKEDLLSDNKLHQNNTDNISKKERIAIKKLSDNTDIVINKADKGSTIVVLDRHQYIQDGKKHLSDENTYKPLQRDTTSVTKLQINRILTKLQAEGFLNRIYTEHCRPPKEYRTSRLYFLKKIHKNPMGIRPIVSARTALQKIYQRSLITGYNLLSRNYLHTLKIQMSLSN